MPTQTQNLETLITNGFNQINTRLDNLDARVTTLEQQGPVLKTRMVGLNGGNGHTSPQPQPQPKPKAIPRDQIIPRHDDDEAEDEAIASGQWAKHIKRSRCNRVSLTKTRKRDAWKLLLKMPGERRPAVFTGWNGTQEIIDFFADVMPEMSLEDFDEPTWAKLDKGQEPPIMTQWDVNFTVEWFKTAPVIFNGKLCTFINVESVYPLYEED